MSGQWALECRYEHSFMPHDWQASKLPVQSFADCLPHLGRRYECGGFVEYRAVFRCGADAVAQ